MTKRPYSESDVEQLLHETARKDRRRMDDAMTERFLGIIREEESGIIPKPITWHAVQWAVAAVVVTCAVVLLCHSNPAEANLAVAPMSMQGGNRPATAMGGASLWEGDDDCDCEAVAESAPDLGAGASVACSGAAPAAGAPAPRRAYLNHMDDTLNAGFTPAPQETYTGASGRQYGVGVYGQYEITACTDTL